MWTFLISRGIPLWLFSSPYLRWTLNDTRRERLSQQGNETPLFKRHHFKMTAIKSDMAQLHCLSIVFLFSILLFQNISQMSLKVFMTALTVNVVQCRMCLEQESTFVSTGWNQLPCRRQGDGGQRRQGGKEAQKSDIWEEPRDITFAYHILETWLYIFLICFRKEMFMFKVLSAIPKRKVVWVHIWNIFYVTFHHRIYFWWIC